MMAACVSTVVKVVCDYCTVQSNLLYSELCVFPRGCRSCSGEFTPKHGMGQGTHFKFRVIPNKVRSVQRCRTPGRNGMVRMEHCSQE
jgi:hypothetical protein